MAFCPRCLGFKEIDNPKFICGGCHGTGRSGAEKDGKCFICDGKGRFYLEQQKIKCPDCKGTGERPTKAGVSGQRPKNAARQTVKTAHSDSKSWSWLFATVGFAGGWFIVHQYDLEANYFVILLMVCASWFCGRFYRQIIATLVTAAVIAALVWWNSEKDHRSVPATPSINANHTEDITRPSVEESNAFFKSRGLGFDMEETQKTTKEYKRTEDIPPPPPL